MKTITEVNATIPGSGNLKIVRVTSEIIQGMHFENVYITTGTAKQVDAMHWSGSRELDNGDYEVKCQRLYKGHYGDATVKASDLYRVLERHAPQEAFMLIQAWSAWIN